MSVSDKDRQRLRNMWSSVAEILEGLCNVVEKGKTASDKDHAVQYTFNDPNDDGFSAFLTTSLRISANSLPEALFIYECLRTLHKCSPIFLSEMCEYFREKDMPFDPLNFGAIYSKIESIEHTEYRQDAHGPLKYTLGIVRAEVIPAITELDVLPPLDDETYPQTFARTLKYLEGIFHEIADLTNPKKAKAKKEKHAKNERDVEKDSENAREEAKMVEAIEERERTIKEMEAKLEELNKKLARAKPEAKPAKAVVPKETEEEPEKMKMSKVCINAIELLLHKKKKTKSFSVKAIHEVIAESTDGEVPVERVQKGLDKAVKKGLLEEKKGLYSMVKK